MYHICFVRDDEIVGYLGYEDGINEVLRKKKEEALSLHDLRSASKRARTFLTQPLPSRISTASVLEKLMFDFVFDLFALYPDKREAFFIYPKKLQIKVISAATGGATETYLYEPK
jgi:hypothetical protein